MASELKCDNGHSYIGTRRKAARQIAMHGGLGLCDSCGKQMRYTISHYYPFKEKTSFYDVLGVHTILSSDEAGKEGWDPMIFIMKQRERADSEMIIWPYYWTKNRNGKWANGQFPPLLSVKGFKNVIEKFEKLV